MEMWSDTCICGATMRMRPFSDNFNIMVCDTCYTQHFRSKSGRSPREFIYDDRNNKYGDQGYLYGRELRWSHRQLLRFNWHGRRTLEIGCFNGFFVSELARLGADAHGVDLNEQALLVGRKSFELGGRLHDTLELAERQGPFDDVLCIDVMEHLEDPDKFLAHVLVLLRPGGRVFIAGPTVERRFFDKSDYPPHHKWRFSRAGLSRLLERSGFKNEHQFIQHDGTLLLRNVVGKWLNGWKNKEFYGDIKVSPPSTESGLLGTVYAVMSKLGTIFFTLLAIPYCSAVLVATKRA
jgi:SAM-dependent methyltransferase